MALPKVPLPAGYRRAQLEARSVAGSLTASAAKRVQAAIAEYTQRLTSQLASLPASTPAQIRAAIEAALKIGTQAAFDMDQAIISAIAQNRRVAFDEILTVYQAAGRAAATTAGVPKALFGAIQTPGVTMAGSYEALEGAASTWKDSLSASAKAASKEVDTLIRTGLANDIGPQELARRLRPYMQGAEEFDKAFPKADERLKAIHTARSKLPPHLRNASFRMQSNALRAAYSEVHNARAEAELQAFALDPLVAAVEWELSPFRGTQTRPDACNVYAENDWYGLGVGRYPLDAVPLPPHPRDRCERIPVARPPDEWSKPKPVGLKRKLKPSKAKLPSGNGFAALTQAQATAVRSSVGVLFRQLDRHASKGAVRKLIDQGYNAGIELAEVAAARQALLTALQTAAAAGGDTTIGLVSIPGKLTGQALADAQSLVKKAAAKSATALQALKDIGADTAQLEAKLVAQKAAAAAKKAVKAKAVTPAPVAPKPLVIADPPAPAPIPTTLPSGPLPVPASVAVNPLKDLSAVELQDVLKQNGVFLLTKAQIAGHFDMVADALADALKGNPAGFAALKQLGADTKKLEKAVGAKPVASPTPKAPTVITGPKEVTPPAPPTPALKTPEPIAPKTAANAAPYLDSSPGTVVLHEKVGEQAGTNPGGFYVGTDGVKRYVKQYDAASQAHGERIVNALYQRLGIAAPESVVFTHQGKVYHAAKLLDGVTEANQIGKLGLTKARAEAALKGFAADVLTMNWDAPGLLLDNLVEVAPGIIARIDNGAAFLHRAQGALKPGHLLNDVTEWDGFAPGAKNINKQYAQLFTTAGYKSPADMGADLVSQIDNILSVEKQVGGWAKFVSDIAPDLSVADRQKITSMLHSRTAFLTAKRAEIVDALKEAAMAKAVVVSGAPLPGNAPAAQTVKQQLKGLKKSGTIKLAKSLGITLTKEAIDQSQLGLAFLKQHIAKAADGSTHAMDVLSHYFKADVAKLQAKLGLKITPAAVPVPSPAAIPNTAAPHVPTKVLIEPHEVAGVQAASKVPEPLYWQGGNTSIAGLKAEGVQLSKLPAGKMGFELEAKPTALKPTSKGYVKLQVAAKNVLAVAGDEAAAVEQAAKLIPGFKSLSAAQRREALVAKGFDAIAIHDPATGGLVKVIVLKPDIVKVVNEAVSPVLIPKPVTPQVSNSTSATASYSGKPLSELPTYSAQNPPPIPAGYIRNDIGGTAHASAHMDARYAATASQVTDAERRAIKSYTASGYSSLNSALRRGETLRGAHVTHRKNLQSAIARQTLGRDLVLYRGLGSEHPYVQLLEHKGFAGLLELVGEVQHDLGFMSTSTYQSVAARFANHRRVYLEVRAPSNTPAWWGRYHGSHSSEHEVILTQKQEYRILEVREENPSGSDFPRIRIIVELIL